MGLQGARYIGLFVPALVLGAVWGWIRFSRIQWVWATVILVAGTAAFVITYHDSWLYVFWGQGEPPLAATNVPVPDTSSPWRK